MPLHNVSLIKQYLMKAFLQQLFKDKNGSFSLRELAVALFVLVIIISWIAQQFFGLNVPEFMFYSFVSLVGAGCFGYSLEKKANS
jgi:hypothetical protein